MLITSYDELAEAPDVCTLVPKVGCKPCRFAYFSSRTVAAAPVSKK